MSITKIGIFLLCIVLFSCSTNEKVNSNNKKVNQNSSNLSSTDTKPTANLDANSTAASKIPDSAENPNKLECRTQEKKESQASCPTSAETTNVEKLNQVQFSPSSPASNQNLPFILTMQIRKKGQGNFVPFSSKDTVQEDDMLLFSVQALKPLYLAIFFYDSQGNIGQLFPEEGNAMAPKLEQGSSHRIPPQGTLPFDEKEGKEYVACFYSDKEINCVTLYSWLQRSSNKALSKFASRGYSMGKESGYTMGVESNLGEEETPETFSSPPVPITAIELDHRKR